MDSTATARERETWKHRLVCLVVAGVWLLPAGAAAQEDAFTLEADEETRPSDPEAVRELTEQRGHHRLTLWTSPGNARAIRCFLPPPNRRARSAASAPTARR